VWHIRDSWWCLWWVLLVTTQGVAGMCLEPWWEHRPWATMKKEEE
jgi:hypothetical protein